MLSACAESMIVSALPAASMILSAPFYHVIMLSTIMLKQRGHSGQNGAILCAILIQIAPELKMF
jgi:hypothetical protein